MGSKHREKHFKLIHQKLGITHLSFKRKAIAGFTELTVQPLSSKLQSIYLNFHSTRITKAAVCIGDKQLDAKCDFDSPLESIVPPQSQKRNLEHFSSGLKQALGSVDPELGGKGELTVHIPPEFLPQIQEKSPVKVHLNFVVDDSSGGIHFVVPEGDGSFSARSAHMFTSYYGNSARLCFPCVDSFFELCTWDFEFTTDESMVAISSGDLIETTLSPCGNKKTFHYEMAVPTAAPNIGWAVGPFEIHPDPAFSEITHFCLPGLMALLKQSTQFFKEAFGHIEDLLSTKFPYSSYKQVFVDQSHSEMQTYASLSILSTSLLHSSNVIDQAFVTRRVLARSLTAQYFTCYVGWKSWNDWWLPAGISGYLYGLYIRKSFGVNEYKYWLRDEMEKLCHAEREFGGLPPLHVSALASSNSLSRTPNPNLTSLRNFDALTTKAHLVMRLLEIQIGRDFLLQVFNKLLSLASAAASQPATANVWGRLLLSTQGFIKILSTVSGKDMQVFLDQWVFRSGCARLHGKFIFNRKRNTVELELRQDVPTGSKKFVGPLTICIQELDGSFKHGIQIEETVSKHDITCHSKSRRNKKKKIPLQTGEEIDMDLTRTDTDSPVLWVRVDPDMQWLRQVEMEQPDFMWQLQMRYERDVVSQLDAVAALERYPSQGASVSLQEVIKDGRCFYRVREEALECLGKCFNEFSGSWGICPALTKLHSSLFGSHSCHSIVRLNDFSDFSSYFVQKAFPLALAKLRDPQKQTPQGVLDFLCQLIRFNDNHINKFSDTQYLSRLIEALSLTVNPALAVQGAKQQTVSNAAIVSEVLRVQTVITEVVHYLNLDKLLPSYRQEITVSCLMALRRLQKFGHLPSDRSIFVQYTQFGLCDDVRIAAFRCLVDFIKDSKKEADLIWLLDFIGGSAESGMRFRVLKLLIENRPFERKEGNKMNTPPVVERLWKIMTCQCKGDVRLRVGAMQLYSLLYGKITPSCLPQGLGVVIDLAKQAVTRKPSIPTPQKVLAKQLSAPSQPKGDTPFPKIPRLPVQSVELARLPEAGPSTLKQPHQQQPSEGAVAKVKSHKHKHKKRKHAEAFGEEKRKLEAPLQLSSASVVSQTLPSSGELLTGSVSFMGGGEPEKKKHKKAKHKEHKEHKHKKHKHHKKADENPPAKITQ